MKQTLISLAIFASFFAKADEGMWMPQQLPQIAKQLRTAGLKLERDPYVGASLLPEFRVAWKPAATTLVWGAVSRAVRSPTPFDVDVQEPSGLETLVRLKGDPALRRLPVVMVSKDTTPVAVSNAFKLGAPRHGGCAFGIDRIIMMLAKEPNIREVIAFPMNQQAEDLMMNAPSSAEPHQLRDVHIKVELPKAAVKAAS